MFWVSAFDKKDGPLTEEENDQYILVKEKMLGNIKFIGQLTVSCLVGGWGGGGASCIRHCFVISKVFDVKMVSLSLLFYGKSFDV